MHRRKVQRDQLLDIIKALEAFAVAQIEDGDETDSNHFQGCTLMIEDDSWRKFTNQDDRIFIELTDPAILGRLRSNWP